MIRLRVVPLSLELSVELPRGKWLRESRECLYLAPRSSRGHFFSRFSFASRTTDWAKKGRLIVYFWLAIKKARQPFPDKPFLCSWQSLTLSPVKQSEDFIARDGFCVLAGHTGERHARRSSCDSSFATNESAKLNNGLLNVIAPAGRTDSTK